MKNKYNPTKDWYKISHKSWPGKHWYEKLNKVDVGHKKAKGFICELATGYTPPEPPAPQKQDTLFDLNAHGKETK